MARISCLLNCFESLIGNKIILPLMCMLPQSKKRVFPESSKPTIIYLLRDQRNYSQFVICSDYAVNYKMNYLW